MDAWEQFGLLGNRKKKPTTYTFSGNMPEALSRKGIADKYLEELLRSMKYSKIQAGAAASREYTDDAGSKITINVNYGISRVHIFVPNVLPVAEEEGKKCPPGFPCFVFATIEKVWDEGDTPTDIQERISDGIRAHYDISFCYFNNYVLLKYYVVESAGHEIYEPGQHVLLGPTPDYLFQPLCCIDKKDLALAVPNDPSVKMNHGYLTAYPLHIFEDMAKKPLVGSNG